MARAIADGTPSNHKMVPFGFANLRANEHRKLRCRPAGEITRGLVPLFDRNSEPWTGAPPHSSRPVAAGHRRGSGAARRAPPPLPVGRFPGSIPAPSLEISHDWKGRWSASLPPLSNNWGHRVSKPP